MQKYPQLAPLVRSIPATFVIDSSGKVIGVVKSRDVAGLTAEWKQLTKSK